ncbi:SDR family NAD(P)-dependent oxidoreductase [Streptomyces kaniharaensis]|uniref:SDR family NAD(P)-dependent oxidoreductase n=1 Tax=Streptomyces kaniharaensis TaxID=212423 RepID=A0A6N7KKJ4_9ACTN|nr:type I polyketide synthase [Streptomyces kaniharaensis]MQS10734.1 SDR family NAD(P)-dependent oxidoreductase [Streptomyces kaniharaensis]
MSDQTRHEPVAVVGMAGRFPGALDIGGFWANLRGGVESIRFPSDEELLTAGVPARALADPRYVKAVATVPEIDGFDAELFGLTPREARICDPQIRLFLECAHAALEDAGYDAERLADVGVFGSAGTGRYLDIVRRSEGLAGYDRAGMSLNSWNSTDYLAPLVSYKLGLHGPSLAVASACSSPLVALHLAAAALRAGECELALVGGAEVELPLNHGYWWEAGGAHSRDGHCRPFDRAATGTVFGSGAAVVALKRLSDAVADRDHVRAVIRATAVTNDGSARAGFAAPSVSGQSAAIAEAMMLAGVAPRDVAVVEAHAAGTVLGDPIEVAALASAYRYLGARGTGGTVLTSVKGNIGHLGHASGMASLIKVVLSLENETVPLTAGFREANPELAIDDSPFELPTGPTPWARRAERTRVAAVNSYGVGGTNAHVIVEEAPAPAPVPSAEDRPRIVVWSAHTPEAAGRYRERLAEHFASGTRDFTASVATLQHGRTPHPYRGAVVAAGARETTALLRDPQAAGLLTAPVGVPDSRIVLLFPGTGLQHTGMALDLYERTPAYATAFDECIDLFEAHGVPLGRLWREAGPAELHAPDVAQPLLFAVEHSLARAWQAWGIRPGAVVGHSLGELAAAEAAGVLTPEDAVRAVLARARALAGTPAGGMLAVAASAAEVAPLLPEEVHVSVVNGPRMVVVAGPRDAMAEAEAALRRAGLNVRPVPFTRASHVPLAAPAVPLFEEALRGLRLAPPALDLYSSAAGGLVTAAEATDPAFWARQLVQPVRFADAVDALTATKTRQLMIEAGPGRALTSALRQHPAVIADRHRVLPTLAQRRTEPLADVHAALTAIAGVWTEGHAIDWAEVEDLSGAGRVPVPGYPYERRRYWADAAPADDHEQDHDHGTAAGSPFALPGWRERPRDPGPTTAEPARTAVAVLPPDEASARRVTVALREAGLRVVPLTPGEAYEEREDGFVVRVGQARDLARVLRTLRERGVVPGLLVHAATVGLPEGAQLPEQLTTGYAAVSELLRQAGEAGPRPELLVLTEQAVDVSGQDPLRPGHAALTALVRPAADGDGGTRLIDLGPTVSDRDLAAELRCDDDRLVALRGGRRWVPAEHALAVAPAPGSALRPAGTYLITGGTGRLGGTLARALAATGMRPVLVLLGRKAAAKPELLAELEALGATVELAACDVTDRQALSTLLDDVTSRHGTVHGVLHVAGPDSPAADVFGPRVFGLAALARAFASRPPLDLFVTVTGHPAPPDDPDRAAADAVLTALAATGAPAAARTLTVAWPRPGQPDDPATAQRGAALLLDLLHAHTPSKVMIRQLTDWSAKSAAESVPPDRQPEAAEAGPQGTDTMGRLHELWTGLLGWPEIAHDADFFDLGGNSLTAVELVTRIHHEFGVDLDIAALFDYPTLDALADQIDRRKV